MCHKNLLLGSIQGNGGSMVLDRYFRKARNNCKEALCLIMALVPILQENCDQKYLLKTK